MSKRRRYDVVGQVDLLIIGSGLAGLAAAHEAAVAGAHTVVATMGSQGEGASARAQGGIAVPLDADDVPLHIEDTFEAGRGLCEPGAVASIIADAMTARDWLCELGMRFGSGHSREGGHSRARILHREGDRTGAHIVAAVGRSLARLPRPPVVLEGHRAVSLCTHGSHVTGALLRCAHGVYQLEARATLLATGGCARLYARSTNPPGACGEGVALGLLAGAVVRDMEFIQFHPTALADGTLVTEALRGAGARLLNGEGDYFMQRYEAAADLAPRDVVTRAVWRESALRGPVLLDLRFVQDLSARFPGLVECLRAQGHSSFEEPIPVMPAAHYAVGGLKTNLLGQTTVGGLYAAGEVASTGLHGANRLASNSMLEAMIMGRRAARTALGSLRAPRRPGSGLLGRGIPPGRLDWLPTAMEFQAGVLRDERALQALEARLAETWQEAGRAETGQEFAQRVLAARLIVRGALHRSERCGVHWRTDATDDNVVAYHLEQSGIPDDGGGYGDVRLFSEKRPVDEKACGGERPA